MPSSHFGHADDDDDGAGGGGGGASDVGDVMMSSPEKQATAVTTAATAEETNCGSKTGEGAGAGAGPCAREEKMRIGDVTVSGKPICLGNSDTATDEGDIGSNHNGSGWGCGGEAVAEAPLNNDDEATESGGDQPTVSGSKDDHGGGAIGQ
jgi:hypothetical protein